MLPGCMRNVCQRKSSIENLKWAKAPMVVRRSDTKTPSKPPSRISTYQQSRGNKLHRTEQSRSDQGLLCPLNPFMPSGFFYLNSLDRSISSNRVSDQFLLLPRFTEIPVLYAVSTQIRAFSVHFQ